MQGCIAGINSSLN